MMQPRPLSPRKTVQLMVILTILAWATQTLFHQWGYGGLILPTAGTPVIANASPATQPGAVSARSARSATTQAAASADPATCATIELRDEAVISSGSDVTLK